MDFWTAIGDVSGVVTVSTFVWQAGKALFKKIHSVPRGMRNPFKKTDNRLTHNPVALIVAPDSTREQWGSITSSNLIALCAAHHGSFQKKLL